MNRIFLCVLMISGTVCLAADKAIVIKPNANLRAKPTLNSEVVCQVQQGDVLETKNLQDEWIEVVPPTNIDFYVFSDYIRDGIVECSQKLNIRAGPGINFSIVGQLENGEKVTVRGTVSEWSRIMPPKNSSLWINRSLVDLLKQENEPANIITNVDNQKKIAGTTNIVMTTDISSTKKDDTTKSQDIIKKKDDVSTSTCSDRQSAKKELTSEQMPQSTANVEIRSIPQKIDVVAQSQQPAYSETDETIAKDEKKDIVAVAPQKTTMPPEIIQRNTSPDGLDLVPSERQGEYVTAEGVLRRKQYLFRSPTDFRLVAYDAEGNPQTICYLKGNSVQLNALLNREMKIYGKRFWVKKQKYPIVIPERIVLK